jgi:copper resistance protein C
MNSLRLAALAAILSVIIPAPAFAHASLSRATPASGSTVDTAPPEVRLYFTERLEAALSVATLDGPDGRKISTSAAEVDPQNPAELAIKLPPLGPVITRSNGTSLQWIRT